MHWDEVRTQLTGLAHMATVSADGVPHVSLVSPALDGDTVWVATNLSSRKARNLQANQRASIMWEGDAEVYVDADVAMVTDTATKDRLWGGSFPYDLATFFGSVDNPDLVLLRLSPRSAVVQTFGASGPERSRWHR